MKWFHPSQSEIKLKKNDFTVWIRDIGVLLSVVFLVSQFHYMLNLWFEWININCSAIYIAVFLGQFTLIAGVDNLFTRVKFILQIDINKSPSKTRYRWRHFIIFGSTWRLFLVILFEWIRLFSHRVLLLSDGTLKFHWKWRTFFTFFLSRLIDFDLSCEVWNIKNKFDSCQSKWDGDKHKRMVTKKTFNFRPKSIQISDDIVIDVCKEHASKW